MAQPELALLAMLIESARTKVTGPSKVFKERIKMGKLNAIAESYIMITADATAGYKKFEYDFGESRRIRIKLMGIQNTTLAEDSLRVGITIGTHDLIIEGGVGSPQKGLVLVCDLDVEVRKLFWYANNPVSNDVMFYYAIWEDVE